MKKVSFPEDLTSVPEPKGRRRASSLKQGIRMPYVPRREVYQHRDRMLRRLRIVNGKTLELVNLREAFSGVIVVGFVFGSSESSTSPDATYQLISHLQKSHPTELRIVYCSLDPILTREEAARQLPDPSWLLLDCKESEEPFLLPSDKDIEGEVHLHTDPEGDLYLRPYSRAYLADQVEVEPCHAPAMVVYHIPRSRIIKYRVTFERLLSESVWQRWVRGESSSELPYVEYYPILFLSILFLLLSLLVYWRWS